MSANLINLHIRHKYAYEDECFDGIKGIEFDGYSTDFFINHLCWAVWTFLYRRDYIINNGIRFHNLDYNEDGIFNAEYILGQKFRVISLVADVYRYVYNPQSLSRHFVKSEARRYVDTMLHVYSHYNTLLSTNETIKGHDDVYKRIKWCIAKQLPNIFSRMLHSNFKVSEYSEIRDKLVELGGIPFEVPMSWRERLQEWLVFHPVTFRIFRSLYSLVYN